MSTFTYCIYPLAAIWNDYIFFSTGITGRLCLGLMICHQINFKKVFIINIAVTCVPVLWSYLLRLKAHVFLSKMVRIHLLLVYPLIDWHYSENLSRALLLSSIKYFFFQCPQGKLSSIGGTTQRNLLTFDDSLKILLSQCFYPIVFNIATYFIIQNKHMFDSDSIFFTFIVIGSFFDFCR
jgi:hypothetical protein